MVLNAPPAWSYSTLSPGILVDSSSTIEIGATGKAAAGAITIDAGKSITANTSTSLSGSLVDNGTLAISGGVLTESGPVSGSGVMQIGADATLLLDGSVAATDTIAFLSGIRASLSIGSAGAGKAPVAVAATITGCQTGDTIVLSQTAGAATAATYTASTLMLVVSDGTTVVETLHLTGSFTGRSFVVTPVTGGASISLINVVAPVVTLIASPTASDAAAATLGTTIPGSVSDALSV